MALLLVKTVAGTVAWCGRFGQRMRGLHLGAHASVDMLEFLLMFPFYIFYALWLDLEPSATVFLLWHLLLFLFLYSTMLLYFDVVLLNFYREGEEDLKLNQP